MSNPFIFHEIITTDPQASRAFFEKLFNWQFRTVEDDSVYIIDNPLPPANDPAGFITHSDKRPGIKPGPMFYIEVDDISAKQRAIVEMGGRTLLKKTIVTALDYDYCMAVYADPQDNQFGLMERVTRQGEQISWKPSQFSFNEISTTDPGTLVREFYCKLFGWKAALTGTPPFFEICSHADLISQAGIGTACDEKGSKQFTSFYLQVPSLTDTLKKVQALGGRQVVPPTPVTLDKIPYEIAMFVDPLGENQLGLMSPSMMEYSEYLDD